MKIRFYETKNGQLPVKRYLDQLPCVEAANIGATLEEVAQHGPMASAANARHIRGKLWEFRSGQHRLFYTITGDNVAYLLHAYKKQTQRAPKREIGIALRRLARLGNDE